MHKRDSSRQYNQLYAPVAQLDRVLGYEPSGREFESLRARQIRKGVTIGGPFFDSGTPEQFELHGV